VINYVLLLSCGAGCTAFVTNDRRIPAIRAMRVLQLGDGRARNRSLPVDLDVFFAAAIGDGDHDANADQDRDSDQSPRRADAFQNTQFPQRSQETANQDSETNKIHTCPFHDQPPDKSPKFAEYLPTTTTSVCQRTEVREAVLWCERSACRSFGSGLAAIIQAVGFISQQTRRRSPMQAAHERACVPCALSGDLLK
jgi:hypothetical protein